MSKCDISIELDDFGAGHPAGGVVRGVVTVEVSDACKCKALSLVMGWHTHGRGNRVANEVASVELFSGNWEAGERVTYPFELALPAGPLSYHGHFLNVDWFLLARADIPWAIDPKCEQDFVVIEGASTLTEPQPWAVERLDKLRQDHDGGVSGGFLAFAGLFLATGCFLVYQGATGDGILTGIVLVFMGVVFVLVSLLMAFATLRNKMASVRLGKVEVDWPERPIHTGETVPLRVRVNGAKGQHQFNATLFCREEVVSGSGTNERTYRHNVYSAPIQMSRNSETPGRIDVEGLLAIPEAGAPSFYAQDNELSWFVELHIDVAGWPDWTRKLYLDVRTGGERAQLEVPPKVEPKIPDFNSIEDTGGW
ncbi:hypothetical protein [Bradymonas sediminis]|uniref:Uncharacterized protein n=1 Tax=Bradymonas sediminis TaxID=1548548 RepID=A0A2Z4FP27_9DELT|nr:hypothetical protein [Bradymonas sediminis]AWV90642.1 hypothetical protein DN745_15450 [Bradymonas sediminis]TDP62355.1 hypothetical protein DFR33_11318 [Bradymonas sediminis]